jgi:hypothetical protein
VISKFFPAALLCCLAADAAAAGAVRPLRDGVELFVDDEHVARATGVTRTLHPARKLEHPVIEGDRPWEKGRVYLYGTVHRDEATGQFRMWYSGGGMAYALSDDGVHWTKPQLPYHRHNDQPTNLLTVGTNLCFVILDDAEPDPAKRYKMLDNTGHHNFIGFYSADGLVWNRYENEPLVPYGSEIANGVRDPRTGQYCLYIRPYLPRFFPKNVREKRLVSVTTSSDFINWSPPKLIIQPDEVDDQWVQNEVQRTEFYGMSGFPYGNHYLGLLPVFRITEIHDEQQPLQSKYEGPIDAQLVYSRDGLSWRRTQERAAVIPTGPHDYDAGCIMNVANVPVVVGDELWYYYTALNTTHGGTLPPKRATIALAKWRLDGLVSLDAGDDEAVVETTLIADRSGALEVNADASGGELRVEVLDARGTPLSGYAADQSTQINGDSVRHLVSWGGNAMLPGDQPYKLRFILQNASLFSYRIDSDR